MSAAQRRKQRRLRSWWRHEQQSIAAALATSLRHSSRGQRKARAGEEESEAHYTAEVRKTLPPQPVLFSLYEEEPGERRPASLAEPPRPQERVPQRTVVPMLETFVPVPSLCRSCAAARRRGVGAAGRGPGVVLHGRCWPFVVPGHWSRGGLLVDDRHIHCPVDPSGGVYRQARAGYKYWPPWRLRWLTCL